MLARHIAFCLLLWSSHFLHANYSFHFTAINFNFKFLLTFNMNLHYASNPSTVSISPTIPANSPVIKEAEEVVISTTSVVTLVVDVVA